LKILSPSFSALVAGALGLAFAASAFAQAQSPAQPPAAAPQHVHQHEEPVPTNLKVLPKSMTGEEVHELMHKWEAALGAECSTCHTADPNRIGPNGRPRLNFADDTKPEKAAARLMFTMVEAINTQYVGKIENSGMPVTCSTCHRGHLEPPPYSPPPGQEHEHREHPVPPPAIERSSAP
jgi:hypothetical protein